MKKSWLFGIFLAFIVIVSTGFVAAKFANEDDAINAAYQCLLNATNKSSMSLEESIYTTLALGYHNLSNATIFSQKSSSADCWPNSGCELKRTSQVGIAYDFLLRNTTGIESWLYSRNGTANGINWFLEIDSENQIPTTCKIRDNVNNGENTITIDETQKISGSAGSCFSSARDGYILSINENCLDREFQISCDENFVTAVLYKKTTSETYYVSGQTHSSVAEGTTSEKVTSNCFKNGNSCDYEGTLWAALALQHFGRDVTPFIPYILALSDEDANFPVFPSAFIYMITESDDSYNQLTQSQQQGKYWRASVNNSRLYDTALGMLALHETNAQELVNARQYLLDIQEDNGCWNDKNIRDTAFILYSGWAQPSFVSDSTGHTPIVILPNSSGSVGTTMCEAAGFSCGSAFSCLDNGGVLKGEFTCSGASECCSVLPKEKLSCSNQGGALCSTNQRCNGLTGSASDGTCCFGSCVATNPGSSQTNECEVGFYGVCKASCGSGEYSSGFSCGTPGFQCCSASSSNNSDSSGVNWLLIILLLLLIGLVVAGIIYRDKVKLWWFKLSNRKQPPKGSSGTPQPRPTGMIPRRMPQFGGFSPRPRPAGFRPRPTPQKSSNPKNKEYEDTLRKLREMSE